MRIPHLPDALCAQVGGDLWFPDMEKHFWSTESRMAREICSRCPEKDPCLDFAIKNNELGIWGGTTERERRRLRRLRERGESWKTSN